MWKRFLHGNLEFSQQLVHVQEFRELKHTEIEVLSEKLIGTPVPDLDKQIDDYVTLRKKGSGEHRAFLQGPVKFEDGMLKYAPNCIGRIVLCNLAEAIQEKMVELRRISAIEGWDTIYDEDSDDDEPVPDPAAKKARKEVQAEKVKRDRDTFESVAKMTNDEKTEMLEDYHAKINKRQKVTTEEVELAATAKVLCEYASPLDYDEFRDARANAKIIKRHEALQAPPLTPVQAQKKAIENTAPWFDVFGKFENVQHDRLTRALQLAGIENPRPTEPGTLDPKKLEEHATEILELTRESAVADRRRQQCGKRKHKVDEVVAALRRELHNVWGVALKMKRKGTGKARVNVYTYEPDSAIVALVHKKKS